MAEPINFPGSVDWSGENPGISLKEKPDGPFVALASFFRVVLSDDASRTRLREVTADVVERLDRGLDSSSIGLRSYHNFRSVSEQAVLQEADWA